MPDNETNSERFKIPKSPKKNVYVIDKFLGCDFTSSPSSIDVNHGSECRNFIRYMPGKIRKRMGYAPICKGTGKAYAMWKWDNDNYVIHIGKTMYHIGRNNLGELDFSVVTSGTDTLYSHVLKDSSNVKKVLTEQKYAFIRSNEIALIFGNGELYFYTGDYKLYTVSDYPDVYIPTVTIGKEPQGGGTSYEAFNLLGTKFEESFYTSSDNASETDYHLSFTGLTSIEHVEVMDSSGEWQTKSEGTDYSVNLQDGVVSFDTAPGQSPAEGEDNVRIIASKTFSGYFNRIAKCKFAIAYGVNGNYDRVFISGNPDYPNYDWYSAKDDATYFPDVNYSCLGSDASPIAGYAIVSNLLVTLKGDGSDRQAAIIRSGSVDTNGEALFSVVKSLQGYPMVAPDTSVVAGIEPMFLTREGIMAITSNDISGDQMMNTRSFFLNGKLLEENHLENAFAIRNGDYYMLFINSHVYILDTLQTITTNNTPYSTRQYATFYWDNVPATCAITIDEVVHFGMADGTIMKFHTNPVSLTSYNDNGTTIRCRYDTADIDALLFFKLKTYRYFAIRIFPSIASTVKIYAYKQGVWELLKEDDSSVRYFSFSNLSFSKLTFKTDKGSRLVGTKVRLKKMDHVRFRIENDVKNEPLMIDQFGIEYTQTGNYKS